MNSPALVLPSSASSTPGSETAIINRTHGLGLDTSPVMKTPPKLEGDATDGSFANKYGRHVIGHIDDYSALRQQIVEGKLLVKKIVSLVRSACSFPGLEAQGTGVLGSKGIHELRSSTSALHHALEESASLLTMFWRAALPSTHIPVLPGKVGESTETELLELRTKVSKQERLLQSTAERLKTANQQKESMEQFIVSQLTRTHDVLKKARTNLESSTYRIACVKPYSCPRKGKIPKGSAVYSSLVTLAFQEPCKKCSHQKSLYRLECSVTWLTETSASQAQVILPPQPPE
ncbi:myomegalin isoform X2 [Pan troglodytes]|uniref:myomegalin isoform X2 n=1 Tax=Pan troglodytes TaxID=9598 RepID=UPI0023F1E502|nr:myomegalin isoform X2 [Pan troglodytes]XP_054525832.1 myomegalin isoform X2 [Pan troglodytes]